MVYVPIRNQRTNIQSRLIKCQMESPSNRSLLTDLVRSLGCAEWLMNRMRGTDALQPNRFEGNTGAPISLSQANRSFIVSVPTIGGAAAQSFL
jgi:hypothetical protein